MCYSKYEIGLNRLLLLRYRTVTISFVLQSEWESYTERRHPDTDESSPHPSLRSISILSYLLPRSLLSGLFPTTFLTKTLYEFLFSTVSLLFELPRSRCYGRTAALKSYCATL
jgi:hypothetical protein